MSVLNELKWRGLIQDTSAPDLDHKLKPGMSFYVGFDPTAPSLQLGNLIPLLASLHLARAGLQPVILFGGATGAIGDPSGKSQERKLIDDATITNNLNKQVEQVKNLFAPFNLTCSFVNNLDWIGKFSAIDFLRDVGKYFTINVMIGKEVVKNRLDTTGISYTEFSYMLLQAYDFYHLYQEKKCMLQIGGSDQWGNITAGLDYIRKRQAGEAYAFSLPLITDSQGRKFGKSEGGALWLDETLTSPYKLHQYLLNVPDSDVIKLLKAFTLLDQNSIKELENSLVNEPEKRQAQQALADNLLSFTHGQEAVNKAKASASVLFGGSLEGLTDQVLLEIFCDVPSVELPLEKLNHMTSADLLVESGLLKSKGEAKRLIANNGAYINNQKVESADVNLNKLDILKRALIILRSGKKSYLLVKILP